MQRQSRDGGPLFKDGFSEVVSFNQVPVSQDAERAVLGAILLSDEHLYQVAEILVANDFYLEQHKCIYQRMLELWKERKRIDLLTLQDDLTKCGELEKAGGIVYLMSLQEDVLNLGLLGQYASIVKEKAVLRELIYVSSQIINRCYHQGDRQLNAVIDEAEKLIFQVSNKRSDKSFVQINIWLKKTFQHLSDIKLHSKGITGIPSGFRILDEMTSGFQNGDLIIAAGRPSMGKTAFALSIASFAARNGFVVGFFSLEMPAEQLTVRILSAESGILHHDIRNATISSDEWIQLTHVAAELANTKIFIDDTAALNIMELRAKARKLKSEHNLQFLIVDYLQLIHTDKQYENRHQEVSVISRSLKALAKELNIPIIALSQLSRAVDSRMDKRPLLSDLRESGAIEQDADLIMFLYRDIVYNADTEDDTLAEVIIGKQRNGPTGTVMLQFVKELTRFKDQ
ncbi:replicative DNA helicase [bacterium]|nr:MAG: replicative DNA helicase [bacterium]QQR61800.1 MAG: replicative DNA helicase [bacterium]